MLFMTGHAIRADVLPGRWFPVNGLGGTYTGRDDGKKEAPCPVRFF